MKYTKKEYINSVCRKIFKKGYNQDIYDKVEHYINYTPYYEKEIFKLYILEFKCNAKNISIETEISYRAILKIIKKIKSDLKNLLKND